MGLIGRIRPIGLIGLIGYLAWVGTLFFGLVYLDDNVLVGAENAFDAIAEVGGGYFYRPIAALSYMVNAAVGGGSPFGYHLVNILLHLATGVLVYWLLIEIDKTYRANETDTTNGWVPLLGALLFLVHPVVTQAVAWIPGRNEILLAIFVLMSLIGLMGHIRLIGRIRLIGLIGHFLFYALALFTKETAVLIPILGLTLIATDMTPRNTEKKRVVIGVLLLVYIGVTLVWFFLRKAVIANPQVSFSLNDIVPALTVFLGSLGKLVFPFNLSTYPIVGEGVGLISLIGLIGLISLIGLIGLMRRMGSMGRTGLLWILLFTAASVVRPNIGDPQAEVLEHRLYLPLIGFVTLIATATINLEHEARNPKQYLNSKSQIQNVSNLDIRILNLFRVSKFEFRILLAIMIIVLLAGLTLTNTRHYRDGISYWTRAVRTSPKSAFAHKQLGVMYYLRKQFDQSQREYEAALAINPREPLVHNNLGVILMDRGRLEEAKGEFERELEVNPGYENAIKNLELIKNKVEWQQ